MWVYQSGLGARGVCEEARSIQLSNEPAQVAFEAFYASEIDRQVCRTVLLPGSDDVANDVVGRCTLDRAKRRKIVSVSTVPRRMAVV